LASLAVAAGHAGFRIDRPRDLVELDLDWPDPAQWQAALAASRWGACPAPGRAETPGDTPLVLEPGLRYPRRSRQSQRRLAAGQPAPRIALAAPTGRAAERMAESLRRAAQLLAAEGIAPELLAPLATGGRTLHRLLGTIPDSPGFRHHAGNPLEVDIVVVDEASMIDLPLMAKLVEAVPDGARLVLLGDPDQLPSVEAGDVLSGILAAAGDGLHLSASDARALQPLLGEVEASATAPD